MVNEQLGVLEQDVPASKKTGSDSCRAAPAA
jgi:hypothetical protein